MKNIACLLTPFHALQVSNLKEELELEENFLTIFYSPHLSVDDLKIKFPKAHLISLPEEKHSAKNVLKNPIFEILKLRKSFEEYISLIQSELTEEHFNLIVCSDKDLFCQLFINKAYRKEHKHNIIAIDEGIGYYRNQRWYNKMVNGVYLLLSKLFLGQSIRYTPALGTHPYLDIVYVRFYHHAVNIRNNSKIRFLQIPTSGKKVEFKTRSEKVLILTAPLSEDQHISTQKEEALLRSVFHFLNSTNRPFDLKQHPRETPEKIEGLIPSNVYIIPKSQSAETLMLSNYKYIINFGSSIVLDLYLKEFPMDRVITICPIKRGTTNSLWEIYSLSNLIDIHNQNIVEELSGIIK